MMDHRGYGQDHCHRWNIPDAASTLFIQQHQMRDEWTSLAQSEVWMDDMLATT